MSDCTISAIAAQTHRLIASRWPTIGVFDSVASAQDAQEAMLLEGLTNDRLSAQKLALIPVHEVVVGQPGASIIMAAFLHPNPEGGRFSDNALGAWYSSFELQTAIDETIYHHKRRLSRSDAGYNQTIQMRELVAPIHEEFHDIRGQRSVRPDLYLLSDYAHSQPFGVALRGAGSNGVCYDSVRREGGTNLVVYRPPLLVGFLQGDHFQYHWTGSPDPQVVKLTNVDSQ